ncbi:MAG TPA: hypothetical protein VGD60_00725 [Candidatus Acidoferrales bacterium]
MADVAVVTSNIGSEVASASPDASTNLGAAVQKNVEVHSGTGGAGVIGITSGLVEITDSGAALLTLAAPVAGAPSAGGNDGQRLTIIATTAHAHTVTTPASGVQPSSHHIITFAAAYDVVELEACNGAWVVLYSTTTQS